MKPDYASTYQQSSPSGEVELRSSEISGQLINQFMDGHAKKESYKKMVSHLIMQTVFKPMEKNTEEPLFWKFMQVVDQVGSAYYTSRNYQQTVAGLFNEVRQHNINSTYSLAGSLEFPIHRLSTFAQNDDERRRILTILEKNKFKRKEEQFKLPERVKAECSRLVNYETDIPFLLTVDLAA